MKLPASVIVLLLVGSACDDSTNQVSTPIVPAPAPQTPVLVTLSGTVTDGISGTPIAAASVALPESFSFRSTFSSTTDERGHYQISRLPYALHHWVVASAMGYLQPCAAQLTLYGDTTINLQLVAASTLSTSSNPGLSRMPGTRNATGIVYKIAEDGQHPAPGVFVGFAPLADIGLSPLEVATTITDTTGRYTLCGLPVNEQIGLVAFGTFPGGQTSISAGTNDAVADITIGL